MADILIRGMEMPKDCGHCRFAVDGWCYAYDRDNTSALANDGITNFCPLVPLPEGHGRLIDADALMRDFDQTDLAERGLYPNNVVRMQETIIEAEGGGEE